MPEPTMADVEALRETAGMHRDQIRQMAEARMRGEPLPTGMDEAPAPPAPGQPGGPMQAEVPVAARGTGNAEESTAPLNLDQQSVDPNMISTAPPAAMAVIEGLLAYEIGAEDFIRALEHAGFIIRARVTSGIAR